jgi:hypothetical protein
MVHCGHEQSGALGTNYTRGDNWKNLAYNFGPKPRPYYEGAAVKAFNGYSIGKGHLAEAKAAINRAPKTNGAKSPFHRSGNGHTDAVMAGSCGNGDTSQRDDLLAKIRTANKA